MAATTLPAPGTDYGPCTDEQCGHRDCALTREDAARRCVQCGRAIGYETRYYHVPDGFAHANCLERLDREQRQ